MGQWLRKELNEVNSLEPREGKKGSFIAIFFPVDCFSTDEQGGII